MRSPASRWGPADSFPFPWEAGRRAAGSRPGRVRCPVGLVCPSVVEPLGGGALPLLAGARPCAGARPLFPSAKGGPDGAKFSHRQPLPARLLLLLLPELPGEGLPGCRAQKRMGLLRGGGGGKAYAVLQVGSFALEVQPGPPPFPALCLGAGGSSSPDLGSLNPYAPLTALPWVAKDPPPFPAD